MPELAVSLGSNLGDRLALLGEAVRRMAAETGWRLIAKSPVYETDPVGVRSEYRHLAYLNAVAVFETSDTAERCLDMLSAVECAMGRVRTEDRYAPRTIDLDLLYHGATEVDSRTLVVPHPRWAERLFVVRPLADVRPDLVIPGGHRRVREVFDALRDSPEGVRLFAREW